MRDTRDRSRSGPPGPFQCRLQRPAALPHAQCAAPELRALRRQRSSSTTTCEVMNEENALSDSGPLRPACEQEVLACDVRVSSVSGAVGYGKCKPIPACPSGTEAVRLIRGRNGPNFGAA